MPLLPLLLALTLFRQVIYLKILRQGSQQPDLAASITLEPSLKPNLRLRSINATCCSSVYPVNIPLEGSDYAASRHIIVDGINQSKILNWADSPNDACLLADIRVKVKKPKREGDACRDVSNKIIQAHNHSGQKLFLLSYFDEPEFTCDPFCGESVDRTDVQYGKRSMTVGRGGFRPGKPANYSAYEAHSRGPVSWLPYSVRTDQVLEMMRLTKYEYNATSAGTFEVREGKLPYLPRLPRKVDARVFRDYLAGRGPKSKTMRNRMAGKVLEIARTHPSLNITVGMVGSKGVKGRTTIHPEYVTGLLSAKVVVLCQPDEYEVSQREHPRIQNKSSSPKWRQHSDVSTKAGPF